MEFKLDSSSKILKVNRENFGHLVVQKCRETIRRNGHEDISLTMNLPHRTPFGFFVNILLMFPEIFLLCQCKHFETRN